MTLPNDNASKAPRFLLYIFLFVVVVLLGAYIIGREKKEIFISPSSSTFTASSSAALTPGIGATIVTVFGDSITTGHGIALTSAYPAQLERMLHEKGYDVSIVNAGVTGETTAGGLRRAEFVVKQKQDIVVIALGGNDVLRGINPASTKANLAKTIEIFQKEAVLVILVGMYAPSNLGATYVAEFNALYPALAKEYGVPLVPFLLEGVVFDKSRNQNDGIHPNEEGAQIIAEQNILPVLLPLLEQNSQN